MQTRAWVIEVSRRNAWLYDIIEVRIGAYVTFRFGIREAQVRFVVSKLDLWHGSNVQRGVASSISRWNGCRKEKYHLSNPTHSGARWHLSGYELACGNYFRARNTQAALSLWITFNRNIVQVDMKTFMCKTVPYITISQIIPFVESRHNWFMPCRNAHTNSGVYF